MFARPFGRQALFAVTLLALINACGGGDNGSNGGREGTTVAWTATLAEQDRALLITPVTALRGERTYAIVLTSAITDTSGRSLQASDAFQKIEGTQIADTGGPIASFDDDVESSDNPYPDLRLVRDDLTI